VDTNKRIRNQEKAMTNSPKSQPATAQGSQRRYWPYLLAFLGVIVGILLTRLIFSVVSVEQKPQPEAPKLRLPPPPEVIAKPHLDKAEQEAEQAVEEHLKAIDHFFSQAKKGTRPFAEHALGFWSKLLLAQEYVLGDDSHKKFIQGKFGEHIFTPSKLEEAVEQVVQSYLAHVRSIEGKMLVAIRADVANFPDTYFLARLDDKMLQQSFDQAISRSMEAVKWDLGGDVGTAVVSFIAGEVLAQVSVQLGIRAGILGAGASSSWFTFGIGLAVGAIVDAIVSWVYDWYANPKGNLAADLDKKLDEMNQLIVEELRNRLKQYAKDRAAQRRAAVLSLLQSQGGAP
jgi:uncharacterized membrane-anchored protein YhcB (DUF1043 family)